MSKLDELRALGAPAISRQLVPRPKHKNRIPSESVDAETRDRIKAVEARVGSPPGGRRPVVVGDTSVQEPSPIDYSKCPACAARRAADAARLAKHRAKKAAK
jgi:hypothetical protein